MTYYFYKTVKDGSRQRLRPLPHQVSEDGYPIQEGLNVQTASGGMRLRETYPIGTIFCSNMCILSNRGGTPYYCAGDIYPILEDGGYMYMLPTPTKEMLNAYEKYQMLHPAYDAPVTETIETATAEEKVIELDLFGNVDSESTESPKKAPATRPSKRKESKTEMLEKKESKSEKPEKKESSSKMNMFEMLSSDERYATPTIDDDGFCITSDNWRILLRNILSKTNTMMVGPTGTGKTELVQLACRKLGIECNVYNMGTIFDPISELLGVHRLKEGSSQFDYAKFALDVQKPGVILLDELSRAPVTTNNVLFPCLDSRRSLPVDMAGADDTRNIKIHPDCVFIATANVGSEYTGTMSMDRALVGRFFPLELGYMEGEDEVKVLCKRFNIEEADARNIVSVAGTVRNKFSKTELSCSLSTRETLMAANLISDGWSSQKAMELTFLPLFEGTVVEGERSVVMQIILSR